MKKALGLALALTFALSLPAMAEEMKGAGETRGTVRSVNVADQSIILEDGTRLWVSETEIAHIWAGDQVQASYEIQGDKAVAKDVKVEHYSTQEAD